MIETPTVDGVRAWSYDELVREGLSLIPAYAPQWTNHNPSDPGITLVELFAYYAEILAYRALRITPDARLNLLRLLEGGAPSAETDALHGARAEAVDDAIRARVQAMSQVHCAVTPAEFERLALQAAAQHLPENAVVRAMCLPGRDLRGVAGGAALAVEAPADVSVILAPEREISAESLERLCSHVQRELAPHCLLTTRVHVIAPAYLHVFVGCRIAPLPGVSLAEATGAIDASLRRRFGPVRPGEPLAGARPLGRALHVAEILEAIDRTDGIDYVEDVTIWRMNTHGGIDDGADSLVGVRIGRIARPGVDARLGGAVSIHTPRIVRDGAGEIESVYLHPWELVRVSLAPEAVHEVGDPAGSDGGGPP